MGIAISEIKDRKLRALIDAEIARSGYSQSQRNGCRALVREASHKKGVVNIAGSLLVRVTRVVASSSELFDSENLVGGAKRLQDAIAAFLSRHGDSEADGLWWEYCQEIGEPEIRIEIFKKE